MCPTEKVRTGNKKKREEFEKRFYYLRDKAGHPVVTVCLMNNAKRTKFARGVSICSPHQNPTKGNGRDRASGRAIEALITNKTNGVIRRPEALESLKKVGVASCATRGLGVFKSEVISSVEYLTDMEKKVLRIGAEEAKKATV